MSHILEEGKKGEKRREIREEGKEGKKGNKRREIWEEGKKGNKGNKGKGRKFLNQIDAAATTVRTLGVPVPSLKQRGGRRYNRLCCEATGATYLEIHLARCIFCTGETCASNYFAY